MEVLRCVYAAASDVASDVEKHLYDRKEDQKNDKKSDTYVGKEKGIVSDTTGSHKIRLNSNVNILEDLWGPVTPKKKIIPKKSTPLRSKTLSEYPSHESLPSNNNSAKVDVTLNAPLPSEDASHVGGRSSAVTAMRLKEERERAGREREREKREREKREREREERRRGKEGEKSGDVEGKVKEKFQFSERKEINSEIKSDDRLSRKREVDDSHDGSDSSGSDSSDISDTSDSESSSDASDSSDSSDSEKENSSDSSGSSESSDDSSDSSDSSESSSDKNSSDSDSSDSDESESEDEKRLGSATKFGSDPDNKANDTEKGKERYGRTTEERVRKRRRKGGL